MTGDGEAKITSIVALETDADGLGPTQASVRAIQAHGQKGLIRIVCGGDENVVT